MHCLTKPVLNQLIEHVAALKDASKFESIRESIELMLINNRIKDFVHDFNNRLCVLYFCNKDASIGNTDEYLEEIDKTVSWLLLIKGFIYSSSLASKYIADFLNVWEIDIRLPINLIHWKLIAYYFIKNQHNITDIQCDGSIIVFYGAFNIPLSGLYHILELQYEFARLEYGVQGILM